MLSGLSLPGQSSINRIPALERDGALALSTILALIDKNINVKMYYIIKY